jgi:hypothetical protein
MTQWGLDTIFNPAKRHMDEEKRRLQSTREEVGDNSGGKRIDLESGKVRIAAEVTEQDESQEPADGTPSRRRPPRGAPAGGSSETGTAAAGKSGKPKDATAEPTAAQIRAAARRGRTVH